MCCFLCTRDMTLFCRTANSTAGYVDMNVCIGMIGVVCFVFGVFILIFCSTLKAFYVRQKTYHLLGTESDDEETTVWEKRRMESDTDF